MNTPTDTELKDWKKKRYWVAGIYWGASTLFFLIIVCIIPGCHVFEEEWFKIIFPILSGCWGISMRAIAFKDYKSSPFPEYYTLYPLALIMNGFAILTLLSLFKLVSSPLFFTAALALGMFMGFYAHPGFSFLGKLLNKVPTKSL